MMDDQLIYPDHLTTFGSLVRCSVSVVSVGNNNLDKKKVNSVCVYGRCDRGVSDATANIWLTREKEKENHQSVSSGSSWGVQNRKVCVCISSQGEEFGRKRLAQVRGRESERGECHTFTYSSLENHNHMK